VLDADPPPAAIHYSGTRDEADGSVHGTWVIPHHHVRVRVGGRLMFCEAPGCAGGWRMERSPGDPG
jgi:hypothetical protein